MAKKDLTIMLASESKLLGEVEYTQALALDLRDRGVSPRADVRFYKMSDANCTGADPAVLPVAPADVKALQSKDAAGFAVQNYKSVRIFGAGRSTLDGVVEMAERARHASRLRVTVETAQMQRTGRHTSMADFNRAVARRAALVEPVWLTHQVDNAEMLRQVADNGIHLMTTSSYDSLRALDADAVSRIKFTHLPALPHTNTVAACEIEFAEFLRHAGGKKANEEVFIPGKEVAFVNLNAGFADKGYPRVTYTRTEAYDHGAALAQGLKPDTALIVYGAGPRYLDDIKLHGEQTLQGFADGFRDGAKKFHGTEPVIIVEEFSWTNQPYNTLKAGFMVARMDNCTAFISPAEGYSAMDGTRLLVDNTKKLVGMFPFEALKVTQQRLDNVGKYNALGIAKLSAGADGQLVVEKHPQEQKTPVAQPFDAARFINDRLGLAAVAPVVARPKLAM